MTRQQALITAEWFANRGHPATVSVTRDPMLPTDAPVTYSVSATVTDKGPGALSELQAMLNEVAARGLAARIDLDIVVADPVA
jgi:hypothetical protein